MKNRFTRSSLSIVLALSFISFSAIADEQKDDVVENPTLKTLSGALNKWSFYSTFTYRGGSLKSPFSAERPNIQSAEETPGLVDLTGNIGLKYRLTKTDNFSLQVGLYSITPFHSTIKTDNAKNARDFQQNHQNLDIDDPTLSYFKTYNLGNFQNVSFVKLQYVTRGIYRDYGLRYALAFSQATAYKIASFAYLAASLTYENYQYDKDSIIYRGVTMSLLPHQTDHTLKANLTAELYARRDLSFRLITDLFSIYSMRGNGSFDGRTLQQTIAMTYFFNRDISISPNLRFIASSMRGDRTNVGLNLNINF